MACYEYNGIKYTEQELQDKFSKTRRILEMQSDLFQKGRDRESLALQDVEDIDYGVNPPKYILSNIKENQFLQLLNKDSNWVTFFVKSIIQDSAKKGYEKVLFPSGNTASKVEGHSTLEEFKREKESRIKNLEEEKEKINESNEQWIIKNIDPYSPTKDIKTFSSSGDALNFIKNEEFPDIWSSPTRQVTDDNNTYGGEKLNKINKEIIQLKQELERVETEGFGALKPIYNFYENTVTNILNKTYGKDNVKVITDEHGNTWNEIILEEKRDNSTIFMKQVDMSNVDQYSIAEKRTLDSNNKLLFNNKLKTPTVNDVLNNIVDNYKDLSDEAKELIKRANNLVGKSNLKIKFVSEDYLDKGLEESEKGQTVMGYDANTNTIVISKDRLEKFNSREVVVAFLHEIVHGQTVEAMQKEPKDRTFAEQELVDVVENFMKTEHAQELKGQYGFKDKFEFVSEFYANPEFRENVKKVSNKWWRDLINSIRRLFTIPANPEYTKLFNTIINFVENEQQDFDGIKRYDGLFRKRFVSEGEYNSLDDKFNILNKKALENVENVLKRTIKANEKRPTELRIKHITETKELLDSIKEYQNTEKWKAVLAYAKAFQSSLNFVNTKLDEIIESKNLYEDDLVPSLERYKEYSASYDLLEDVRSLLNKAELEQTTFNEEERKEYKELHEFFNKALASKTDVDGKFQAIYHKQGLKLYSNPIYNTEVETIHRDELRKEYNNLSEEVKQGRSVDEYINEMINTRDLNDFSEDLKAKATNVMSEPSLDIDQSSLWLDDSLNIKSPTIQIINNVFGHNFSIVKDFVLTKVHQMDKNYKEFTKGKSHKPSEINKNLIEKTEYGQHYLRGKYSIKYKESFDKLLDEIKEEQDNSVKKLAVQDSNFESVKKDKKTISLRPTNGHGYIQGEIVTITVNGIKTGVKVQIDEVHSFNGFKSLSDERKNDFAKSIGNYKNYEDFLNSNDYAKSYSKMSQMYPEVYNFINSSQSMDIISYKKVEDNDKEYESFKNRNKKFRQWFKNNTIKKDGKTIPHPKFLNKDISKEEQKQLNFYTQIWDENDKIEGFSSLVNKTVGARFYQLASNTKSDLERRIESDTKGLLKDKWDDLTKVKPDDIGIQNDKTPGSLIQKVKTHYRGKIDSNLQSLDLETMARNEYWNGQNYKSKKDLQHKMNVFLEVVASKPYYDKKGGKTYSGIHSKEYKKILGMVERNVYDIFSHQSDMNKVTSQISGYAASLAMSFNLASGTANLANGLTVLFVEKFGNDKIKSGTLGKAETKYTKELLNGNLLKDATNSVKKHYFNQLLEKFDVMGGLGQNEQEAIRNSLLSKFGSTKMMNFINEGGEHMMHCVVTEAILDSIKVMNSDYKYIDKDGKVTTEDKAASLVDMLYMDSQGQLQMSDKVFYTSQNRVTKYHEGGSSNVNMLVKKKVFDLFGVYDVKFKNELSKTWYGKTVMMFKNFFMSGLANRWTGIKTSTKDKSLLENDDKFYNSAEKEYIEGTYVTMIRFVKNNVIPNLKELSLIYQSYDNLSDYEKANLRKATMELLISSVVLPSVGFMLAALAGSKGDDDDDMLWFAIYLNARLGQELRQFWNPIDANKMISNPVAATRFINNGLNFCYDIISPINFSPSENESTFDYLSEDKKGRNILGKHFNQLIPITSQFKELGGFLGKDYHQMYGLQYGK